MRAVRWPSSTDEETALAARGWQRPAHDGPLYAPERPGERAVREMNQLEAWYRAHPRSRPERRR